MTSVPLIGRDEEIAGLLGLLESVSDHGVALVVKGAAGVGKSSLLAEARRIAIDRGMVVMATAGVQSEAELPFAGLHQLMKPALGRIGALPPPQREAVRAAFGMGQAATPEPFLIALGALELLSEAGTRRPLLLAIEDAHWLDRPSADGLAFVARRLEYDPIVMLVALREGYESPLGEVGLPVLDLTGLSEPAAESLLDQRFPALAAATRARVLEEAEGNPLALLELAAFSRGPLRDDTVLPRRHALPARLEEAFAARAAELPTATRTLLHIAAADEGASLQTLLAGAEIVDGEPHTIADLEPAIRAQLIEVDGQQARFRHSLVRSAIYQAASVGRRQAAHRALATLFVEDPDRSAWHLAAAAIGPDSAIASELEAAGRRALERGAVTTAAAAFERASALAVDLVQRERLLLDAAAAATELGRGKAVARLLAKADPSNLEPRDQARWMMVEDAFLDGPAGDVVQVQRLVKEAAVVATDRDLALNLLAAAALRCYWGDLEAPARDVLGVADSLGVPPEDPRLLFIQAFAAPIERGAVVLGEADRAAPPEDAVALYLLGMAVCLVGAFDRAMPLLGASAQRLREQGRLPMLAQVLSIRAWAALELADFAVAIPAAEEAGRLSSESARPLWQTGASVAQATLAALRGNREDVEALTAEAERIALPAGASALLSLVQYARGLLELGSGRHEEAYEHLHRIAVTSDPAHHRLTLTHVIGDLVEAAVHSGHRETAAALTRELAPLTELTPSPWFHCQMLLARAHLATDEEADAFFEEALGENLARWPMIRARLELAYGERLRRSRRRRDSRPLLRGARETFDALGVSPWAERARRELRASGERSSQTSRDSLDDLTSQELQIAQLAAQGLSNREIAQRLYLSHRTVESHLYRVFPKLAVTSRAQLGDALGSRLGAPE